MHPLHDYFAKQLADKLSRRGVVVWYDPRREFAPFFDELRGSPRAEAALVPIQVAGVAAQLADYDGSMFELRALAEPLVAGDVPGKLVVYLPGVDVEPRASVLLELELAGERITEHYKLKQLARNVLRDRYTDGVIDELTDRPGVGYAELAEAAMEHGGAEPPSILKGLFPSARAGDDLVTAWLASSDKDDAIVAKHGTTELVKLVRSRLGLELPADGSLAKLRALTLRYVLGSEFRSDLTGVAPASLDAVPVPKNGNLERVRSCAHRLRTDFVDAYAHLADRVEDELGLFRATIDAARLGGIDTFRFEERALLAWCGELIVGERYDEAQTLVTQREHSYWLGRDVGRKAQWEACRRMADLGRVAAVVRAEVGTMTGSALAWIEAYTRTDGWYRLDLAQRRLESWLTQLDEDCAEAPLGVVRRAYDEACRVMAEGFTKALVKAHWNTTGVTHQTHVYDDAVATRPRPVAYILVDAMRFEMGVELVGRLPRSSEVAIRPAVTALPSITPVGMSALLPGAAVSYSVVEQGGKLGGRIDSTFLPDLPARKKHAAARLPDLADVTLDDVLTWKPSRLAERVAGKQTVIIRSQEIDHAGETGFTVQARQVMDTVIDNLARALRRLAVAGIEHAVITADHGHLFFAADRDPSLRIDAPGGATVELHRRCWIGRGGTTPAGCVRVSASALGYDGDLDLVFPAGAGVFKAGGDLAFHHGGPSLQEMVVPVVTVRTKVAPAAVATKNGLVTASYLPTVITARALSATFQLGGANLALFANALTVRPLLMAGGKLVGVAGMAVEAALVDGCVTLEPKKPVTVAFLLADPSVASVRIVIQDPATDAELYQSAEIPVRLGM
jgi:hypothetical protein